MRTLGALLALLLAVSTVGAQPNAERIISTFADFTVTNGALVTLCVVNASRVACTCVNKTAGTPNFRVGDSATTTTQGLPVLPQSYVKHTGSEALFGISEGANVTVSCVDTRT